MEHTAFRPVGLQHQLAAPAMTQGENPACPTSRIAVLHGIPPLELVVPRHTALSIQEAFPIVRDEIPRRTLIQIPIVIHDDAVYAVRITAVWTDAPQFPHRETLLNQRFPEGVRKYTNAAAQGMPNNAKPIIAPIIFPPSYLLKLIRQAMPIKKKLCPTNKSANGYSPNPAPMT